MMWQTVLNGLAAGSAYALIALGFSLIYQAVKFFHLSHGAVFVTSAYAAYFLAARFRWPWIPAVLFAVLAGILVGISSEWAIFRRIRRRDGSPQSLLIVSLGILIVVQSFISLIFGDATLVYPLNAAREGFTLLGGRVTGIQFTTVAVSIVLTVATWYGLRSTKWGKMARAIGCDEQLSLALGLDRDAVILVAFAVGSAYAGIAGVLAGYDNSLSPSMGFRAILVCVVAFIVGGTNNTFGAILGGLFVGLAENIGTWVFASRWRDFIVFAVLMVFLVFRPQGILGRVAGRERL